MTTVQLPIRVEPNTFDPLLCADLHNRIVDILRPTAEEHNFPITRNFFVAYGDRATEMRDQLSQPLITFLENIDIIDVEESRWVNFAPHLFMPAPLPANVALGGLGGTSWNKDLWNDEDDERWMALYLGDFQPTVKEWAALTLLQDRSKSMRFISTWT